MSDEKQPDTKIDTWPVTPLGPFRYALVGGLFLEYKNGKWVDETGQEVTLTLSPPKKAAHRP